MSFRTAPYLWNNNEILSGEVKREFGRAISVSEYPHEKFQNAELSNVPVFRLEDFMPIVFEADFAIGQH